MNLIRNTGGRSPRISWRGAIGATVVVATLPAIGLASTSPGDRGPAYDSPETRVTVERMLAAHGGMDAWRNAEAIAFEHVMFMPQPPQGRSVWALHTEVVDQASRRSYQEYPLTGARLGDDGTQIWSSDWAGPSPPRMMSKSAYYFTFIPWLTQDEGVSLETATAEELPDWDSEIVGVRMTFDGGGDTFLLLLDATTGHLEGLKLWIGDRRILDQFGVPSDVDRIPGPLHEYRTFGEAGGLRVPLEYHTRGPDGSTIGYHVMSNINLDARFEEDRLAPPTDAEFGS